MSFGFAHQGLGNTEYGFSFDPRLERQLVDVKFAELVGQTYMPVFSEGWLWGVQRIDGWWMPAPSATAEVGAPSGDGVLPLYPRMGARPITLDGFVAAERRTPSGVLEEALDALARARSGTLVVNELKRGLSREADCRVTDMKVTRLSDRTAKVTLSLQADDPLRYGSGVQALKNGRNVLLNPGDARAWPVLEVKGPTSKLTIVDSAGTFTLPAVPSGQSRTVDGRNGEVWNGNNRVFDATGLWPRVLVGGAEWNVSGIGSGSVLVRRFQAWT